MIRIVLFLSICFLSFSFWLKGYNKPQKEKSQNLTERLYGNWLNSSNTDQILQIFNKKWNDINFGKDDWYLYSILDSLPKYVDPKIQADLIAVYNKTDTTYFEIIALTDSTLSLMHYPSAQKHFFNRLKRYTTHK